MSVKAPQVHEKRFAQLAAENAGTQDLLAYCHAVIAEYARLYHGIKKHDACWENDLELWRLIDDSVQYPHKEVPHRDEFLTNCRPYYNMPVPRRSVSTS